MTDLVSVIIPVYNVEMYLKRCLDSLAAQSYKSIEVILVEDCSTDNSLGVCRELQNEMSLNISIIAHDKNMGLEATRNDGLKTATGKWVMFLDSDDTYEPNGIMQMVKFASDNKCDLVFSPYVSIYPSRLEERKAQIDTEVVSLENFLKQCVVDIPFDVMSCVGAKIYRRSIIEDYTIRFDKRYKYNEDAAFMLTSLSHCTIVGYINQHYYNYFRRDSKSIQSSYREHMFPTISESRKIFKMICIEKGCFNSAIKVAYIRMQVGLIFESLSNQARFSTFSEFVKEAELIQKSEDFILITSNKSVLNTKQRIVLSLLNKGILFPLFVMFEVNC